MKVEKTGLPGVLLITPDVHADIRGFFIETYHQEKMQSYGIVSNFTQDNLSHSKKGVVRGLHFQYSPHAQDKLIRCVSGSIFDVAVDIDPVSATHKHHVSVALSEENHQMLFIPGKYAHGFCALTDATVEYKVGDLYAPEYAGGVRYDDLELNIPWPVLDPIVSEQDQSWPVISKLKRI